MRARIGSLTKHDLESRDASTMIPRRHGADADRHCFPSILLHRREKRDHHRDCDRGTKSHLW